MYENMDLEKGYQGIFEMLWYSQMPCFDVKAVTSSKDDEHGMCDIIRSELHVRLIRSKMCAGIMKRCAWKGLRVSCSSIFTMFPTDRGMCCSFNMQKAEEMFRESKYKEFITKLEQRDKDMSFENSTIPEWLVIFYKM